MTGATEARQRQAQRFLRVTPSSEIYLKSRRTRNRFIAALIGNLEQALAATRSVITRSGYHELRITSESLDAASAAAAGVFGVGKVEKVRSLAATDLPTLADDVVGRTRDRVAGRTFAVRVRRRGRHDWKSKDAEILIGRMLLDGSAGVDLDEPEEMVRVYVNGSRAVLVESAIAGPAGLPIGTQQRSLVLLSGGIDSPVAAWMMMRRGCPVDFVHLKMDCAVADHALVVGHDLVERWGPGMSSDMHVVDFQPIKDGLHERVAPRIRQVVLKQLMVGAAHRIALDRHIPLLVTGDSLGQVSSQTAAHLAETDRFIPQSVIRPLVAMSKEEIVGWARRIGTYELSIQAREVCDLSEGKPVETAAASHRIDAGLRRLGLDAVDKAMRTWETVEARRWMPGMPLEPAA